MRHRNLRHRNCLTLEQLEARELLTVDASVSWLSGQAGRQQTDSGPSTASASDSWNPGAYLTDSTGSVVAFGQATTASVSGSALVESSSPGPGSGDTAHARVDAESLFTITTDMVPDDIESGPIIVSLTLATNVDGEINVPHTNFSQWGFFAFATPIEDGIESFPSASVSTGSVSTPSFSGELLDTVQFEIDVARLPLDVHLELGVRASVSSTPLGERLSEVSAGAAIDVSIEQLSTHCDAGIEIPDVELQREIFLDLPPAKGADFDIQFLPLAVDFVTTAASDPNAICTLRSSRETLDVAIVHTASDSSHTLFQSTGEAEMTIYDDSIVWTTSSFLITSPGFPNVPIPPIPTGPMQMELSNLVELGLSPATTDLDTLVREAEKIFHHDLSTRLTNTARDFLGPFDTLIIEDPGSTALRVTSPSGFVTGLSVGGMELTEIPGAAYFAEIPAVVVFEPEQGHYTTDVVGLGSGPYDITFAFAAESEIVSSTQMDGEIATGAIVSYGTTVDLDAETANTDVLAVDVSATPGPMNFLEPNLGRLFVIGGPDDDRITISDRRGELKVSVNGTRQQFDATKVASIVVEAREGNDSVRLATRKSTPVAVHGGAGNDFLLGSRGSDILLGGEGNDVIVAGRGADLVIGGQGVDVIFGGLGRDILIGGSTRHDEEVDALFLLREEWLNTNHSHAQRVANLRGQDNPAYATRQNGDVHLSGDDYQHDQQVDLLFGGLGRDWYFTESVDFVFDKRRK